MLIQGHDTNQKVFIVAEIGNNHEGNFSLAQEMLGRAAESGADAVKFQTFIPELYVANSETDRLARLKKFQLLTDEFEQLAKQASELGIIFFSTPFDLESAKFLNTIQSVFKISSGDNTFYPLIELIAGFHKPLIVSTGLADFNILEQLAASIQNIWKKDGVDPGLSLLHCVSSYPVPPAQANIRVIERLKDKFPDCIIGYSDHTLGSEASVYAVASGARIIEKHFTTDKNYSDFRDHQLSADPAEFKNLVEAIRRVELFMGHGNKTMQDCEKDMKTPMRRSVAAKKDIPAGQALTADDFTWVRPGIGFAPGEEKQLIGRVVKSGMKKGQIISPEDISSL